MFETVFIAILLPIVVHGDTYIVDDIVGVGRRFDGIGGLSGGSATSKLLIAYPEKQRNEILDYLFKPKFGAALQILKVEIGGDAQASDATEASHMHVEWEENYQRGYEWWLMKEAKKRNPDITLYGLPWNFPGWLGNGTQNPFYDRQKLANYIVKWINGAFVYHNLRINYIGIWNELTCDIQYIKVLRNTLDSYGFEDTKIVASDSWWSVITSLYTEASVSAAIDVLGVHYPGVTSPESAKLIGKQLWSSEDYSTFNDEVGGGCWARILNQNYVRGLMTRESSFELWRYIPWQAVCRSVEKILSIYGTIAWNLIDSFFQGLPWDRDSLMTAREPWSGNYVVESPIWMTSHTTQLTEVGWKYLAHQHGVGMLNHGGSYVTLVSPDFSNLTIVIETMSHDHSVCIRPGLPAYTVIEQTITFSLGGSFAGITTLHVWESTLRFNGLASTYFQYLGTVPVINGKVTITAGVDQIISLSTVGNAVHGEYETPPPDAPFPLPFVEDFEAYNVSEEPYMLAPQQGSYDVVDVGGEHGKVMRQMVLQPPIAWCQQTLYLNASLNVVGRFNWTDVDVSVDVKVGEVNGSNGVFLGARIDNGGCTTYAAKGIFFFIFPNDNVYMLTNDIKGAYVITSGRETAAIVSGWNSLTLSVKGALAIGTCNGVQLFKVAIPVKPANGFVGVGTDVYGYADFDNIHLTNAANPDEVYFNEIEKGKSLYFVKEKP